MNDARRRVRHIEDRHGNRPHTVQHEHPPPTAEQAAATYLALYQTLGQEGFLRWVTDGLVSMGKPRAEAEAMAHELAVCVETDLAAMQ